MPRIDDIPLIDTPPEQDYQPRQLRFRIPPLKRRSFLRTVGVGGMALGITAVGFLPNSHRAEATVGTEWKTGCGGYSYDNALCTGAPYSKGYCGGDKWFKNGCWTVNGLRKCYRPITVCNGRNAWRWWSGSVQYRCADGYVYHSGNRYFRICSAYLWRR